MAPAVSPSTAPRLALPAPHARGDAIIERADSAVRRLLASDTVSAPELFEREPQLEALLVDPLPVASWVAEYIDTVSRRSSEREGIEMTVWDEQLIEATVRSEELGLSDAAVNALCGEIRREWHWFEATVGRSPVFAILRLEWTPSLGEFMQLFQGPSSTAADRCLGFMTELQGAYHQDDFSWISLKCLRRPGTLYLPGAAGMISEDGSHGAALRQIQERLELHATRLDGWLRKHELTEIEDESVAPALRDPRLYGELLGILRAGAAALRAPLLCGRELLASELAEGSKVLFQGNEIPGGITAAGDGRFNPQGLIHAPWLHISAQPLPRLLLMVRC